MGWVMSEHLSGGRLVEKSGLWRLPETVVIAIGGRAGVRAVLLHHSLRNTVHALYLALNHDASIHALTHAFFHAVHDSPLQTYLCLRWLLVEEAASINSGVRVYRRCLYCNNGEADAQLVHNMNINSFDLPWDDLFQEEPFQDFMGNKMKIVTPSPYFPYVDYQRVSEAPGTAVLLVDCLDARLIHTFADKLNFTFNVQEDMNRTLGVERNGSFSGMIGLLQREEREFSTISAPTAKRLKAVDYLMSYPSDPFIIASLKPTLLPKSLALVRPFTGELWVTLLVSVVAWGVTLWLLQRAWQWVAGGRPVGLVTSLMYGYGALLQNLPSDPSASISGRMLVGWWLVFCLIVTTGFSSSLMAHLTVQGRSRPLETFEDLVTQPGWRWGTVSWMLTEAVVDYFVKHPNPAVNQVYHKMEVIEEDEALKKVLAGKFSFISFKNFVTVNVATHFTDERGNNPFHTSRGIPMFAAFGWCIR
nr:probable glutamate receptor [Procambarus clarkii]